MAPLGQHPGLPSFHGDWRASKVVGLNVYNDNNQSIGSINDLLMDKSGNIKAAVISVGGFLGVGEHLVAVPFEKVKFVNEPVPYTGVANTASVASAAASRPRPRQGAATTGHCAGRRPIRGIRITRCSTRPRMS